MTFTDNLLKKTTLGFGLLIVALFIAMIISLLISSHLAWHSFGLGFIWHSIWNPGLQKFSALSAIVGTVVSAAIALAIALPVSIGIASFTMTVAPTPIRGIVGFALQVMAGIPSIIYGMWGLFVLVPFFAGWIQPALSFVLGWIPFIGPWFSGPPIGIGLFTAGLVLAIMITPLLTTMMLDLFNKVPSGMLEAAYAQGATHWEVIRYISIPYTKQGVIGSTLLGLGRALGETMAVTFVIGNAHILPRSLFMPSSTIASTIANEFTEATQKLYSSSLMGLGLILMVITFITIIIARLILRKPDINVI